MLYSITIRHPTQIPNATNISIPASLIPSVFSNNDLTNTLQLIANSNYNKTELHFYTDGSVIQAGTSQCSMGIGWALVQNNLWSTTNILHHPNLLIDRPNKQTTSFKIIQLFSHLGLSVTPNPMYDIPYTVNTGTITLESILSSHSKYLSFKKQLRQHHILFLDQLTTYDNFCLLD